MIRKGPLVFIYWTTEWKEQAVVDTGMPARRPWQQEFRSDGRARAQVSDGERRRWTTDNRAFNSTKFVDTYNDYEVRQRGYQGRFLDFCPACWRRAGVRFTETVKERGGGIRVCLSSAPALGQPRSGLTNTNEPMSAHTAKSPIQMISLWGSIFWKILAKQEEEFPWKRL